MAVHRKCKYGGLQRQWLKERLSCLGGLILAYAYVNRYLRQVAGIRRSPGKPYARIGMSGNPDSARPATCSTGRRG